MSGNVGISGILPFDQSDHRRFDRCYERIKVFAKNPFFMHPRHTDIEMDAVFFFDLYEPLMDRFLVVYQFFIHPVLGIVEVLDEKLIRFAVDDDGDFDFVPLCGKIIDRSGNPYEQLIVKRFHIAGFQIDHKLFRIGKCKRCREYCYQ